MLLYRLNSKSCHIPIPTSCHFFLNQQSNKKIPIKKYISHSNTRSQIKLADKLTITTTITVVIKKSGGD